MKRLADYFFFSSFFISLCAFGLVLETCLLTRIPLNFDIAGLIFFATLFLYNFDSLLPYKTAQQTFVSEKKRWLQTHRRFLTGVCFIAAVGCLFLYARLYETIPILFILPFFLISVLYSLPLISTGRKKIPLRDIPFLKVFLIAGVWAGLTVLLPLLVSGKNMVAPELLLLFARRFLFIFALTLLFDIRDLAKDAVAGTITFPVKFGSGFTKKLAYIALFLFALLVHFQETGPVQIALEISAVTSGLVVYFANEKRPEYYFAVFADGMMLLQFLVVLAFR